MSLKEQLQNTFVDMGYNICSNQSSWIVCTEECEDKANKHVQKKCYSLDYKLVLLYIGNQNVGYGQQRWFRCYSLAHHCLHNTVWTIDKLRIDMQHVHGWGLHSHAGLNDIPAPTRKHSKPQGCLMLYSIESAKKWASSKTLRARHIWGYSAEKQKMKEGSRPWGWKS